MSVRPYNSAIMSSRASPPDSIDFFPSPPWSARAVCRYVLPWLGFDIGGLKRKSVWDPGAGQGHMIEPLGEFFGESRGSDVFDYGVGHDIGSYIGDGPDVIERRDGDIHWIITNPPFIKAEEFLTRALSEAIEGVAFLARTVFIESEERGSLFDDRRFMGCFPFRCRVPMVAGQWDPQASSATSFAWFVWLQQGRTGEAIIKGIPTEARGFPRLGTCWRSSDVKRFAGPNRCGVEGLSKKKRDGYEADAPGLFEASGAP